MTINILDTRKLYTGMFSLPENERIEMPEEITDDYGI